MKTRMLSLLVAVTLALPQLALGAAAKSEVNYLDIKEELLIENGAFDEAPVVRVRSDKAYKNVTVGAFALIKKGGTAKAEHVTEDENSYIRFSCEESLPTVAYRVGTLEAGKYTLSFDVRHTSDAMDKISVRIFPLDDDFTVATGGAALLRFDSDVLTKDKWNTVTRSFELTEATDIAFDFYTIKGVGDATITGNLDIDNLTVARPTHTVIETADLDSADNEKVYTGATDPELPSVTWTATDLTSLALDTEGDVLYAKRRSDDDLLQIAPTVMYAFKQPLVPGDYRLTLGVDTADTKPGWMSMVGDVTNTKISTNHKDVTASPYTYTAEFTVPEGDSIPVGFRYWSNGDVVPAKPFSITSMKLEKNTGTETLTEHDPITIAKNSSTDADHPFVIDTKKDDTTGSSGKWSLKGKAYATLSLADGVLKFEEKAADDNQQPNLVYNMGTLDAGNYTVYLDIKMDGGRPAGQQFEVKYPGTAYFDPAPWVTDTPVSTSVSFNLASETSNCVFRFYPHNNGKNIKYIYTVDNFSVVKTASLLTEWNTVESCDFTSVPDIYDVEGVNFNSLTVSGADGYEKYAGKWCVRDNSFGAVYLEHDAVNGCLKIVGHSTAINGKPLVMYAFENTLSKGDYSVDINIKSEARDFDWYKIYLCDKDGAVIKYTDANDKTYEASQSVKLAGGKLTEISFTFSLDQDKDIILCLQPLNTDSRNNYISAYRIESVTVNKITELLLNLYSNAEIAKFESDEGVYYMTVNSDGDAYVNYCTSNSLRTGTYKLSGKFRTTAPEGAELHVTIDGVDGGKASFGDEWTPVELDITLLQRAYLTISDGIKLSFDTAYPVYFKDLKLTYEEELPKPSVSPAITMLLIKKMAGTYPGFVNTKPIELMTNGDFDEEVTADHEQSRSYQKHEDGKWTYSRNSGTVAPKVVKDQDNSYLYFEVADANPTVGYRVGTVPAGKYTLSFDIMSEFDIGNLRTRIFRLDDGFAVGKTEYVLVDRTLSLKIGKTNTLTYEFELTEDTPIAFNFYATKEKPCPANGSFRLDNVSLLKQPK